jgi:epidermal growth factor receptor substrate 15
MSTCRDLADTQVRGALDSTDFAIGMYLIQHTMNGSLPSMPSSLPLGLYEQAGGNPQTSSSIATSSIPAWIPALPHSSDLRRPRANTVSHTPRSSARPSRAATIAITPSRPPGDVAWDVTSEEKVFADGLFDTLDTDGKGYITGDVAVPFMLDSKLDVQSLAKIWCVPHTN